MQHLSPGFQLDKDLILAEELPVPPHATFRMWRALNIPRSTMVLVKIFSDHHVVLDDAGASSDCGQDLWNASKRIERSGWENAGQSNGQPFQNPSGWPRAEFREPVSYRLPGRAPSRPKSTGWGLAAIILLGVSVGIGYWYWLFRPNDKPEHSKRQQAQRREPTVSLPTTGQAVHADTVKVVIIPPIDTQPESPFPPNRAKLGHAPQAAESYKPRMPKTRGHLPAKQARKTSRSDTVFVPDQNL